MQDRQQLCAYEYTYGTRTATSAANSSTDTSPCHPVIHQPTNLATVQPMPATLISTCSSSLTVSCDIVEARCR